MPVGSLVVHQFLCSVQTRNALTLIRLMLLGKTAVQIITPLLSGAYRRTVGLEYWREDPFVDTRVSLHSLLSKLAMGWGDFAHANYEDGILC